DDQRARRNLNDQILGTFALLICPAAGRAARRPPKSVMSQRGQIVDAILSDDDDAASFAAIPAVGAAMRHVLLAPEADTAVAARAKLRPALADNDVAGVNLLTTKSLDTATLRVRIAAVARRALTLLMCHSQYSVKTEPKSLPINPNVINGLIDPIFGENLLLFRGVWIEPAAKMNLFLIRIDRIAWPPEIQLQRLSRELTAGTRRIA